MTITVDFINNLYGRDVYHTTYGKGTITGYDKDGYVEVTYENNDTYVYSYPSSLCNGILSFTDSSNQSAAVDRANVVEEINREYAYKRLIERIKLQSSSFEGLVHTTSMDNFISVIRSGVLSSRGKLKREDKSFTDAADKEVLDHTKDTVKDMVRFYYGFSTPTNYRAHYKIPVIMVFDTVILKDNNTIICDGNAASEYTIKTNDLYKAYDFDWYNIFERGTIGCDSVTKFCKIRKRNAEVLYPEKVSINRIKRIYFRTNMERSYANEILGDMLDMSKCFVNEKKFVGVGCTDDKIL